MARDSFVFYRDWADALKSYPIELKSELFDCIVDFALDGCEKEGCSEVARFIFETFRPKLIRDAERYAAVLERRKESGSQGGKAKAAKLANLANASTCYNDLANLANASECQQNLANLANLADNDNVNDNVNVNDNENINDILVEEVLHTSLSTNEFADPQNRVQFARILEFVNNAFAGTAIPQVRGLSDSRKKHIRARINEHGIDAFYEVIDKAAHSAFLNGSNDRRWKASFDWIIKPTNFCKVLDGNYDDSRQNVRPIYADSVQRRQEAAEAAMMQAAERIKNICTGTQ